jgi:hypothetical protein
MSDSPIFAAFPVLPYSVIGILAVFSHIWAADFIDVAPPEKTPN